MLTTSVTGGSCGHRAVGVQRYVTVCVQFVVRHVGLALLLCTCFLR